MLIDRLNNVIQANAALNVSHSDASAQNVGFTCVTAINAYYKVEFQLSKIVYP